MNKLCLIVLLMALPIQANNVGCSETCAVAAAAFLHSPTFVSLKKVETNQTNSCWNKIGGTNETLRTLLLHVNKGNRWAAEYAAKHLSQLDGGNLEDALTALGEFSERHMGVFFSFKERNIISHNAFVDALTMLPPSMSDDFCAQMIKVYKRERAVTVLGRQSFERLKQRANYAMRQLRNRINSAQEFTGIRCDVNPSLGTTPK